MVDFKLCSEMTSLPSDMRKQGADYIASMINKSKIIIAQAIEEQLEIITKDQSFQLYNIDIFWYIL